MYARKEMQLGPPQVRSRRFSLRMLCRCCGAGSNWQYDKELSFRVGNRLWNPMQHPCARRNSRNARVIQTESGGSLSFTRGVSDPSWKVCGEVDIAMAAIFLTCQTGNVSCFLPSIDMVRFLKYLPSFAALRGQFYQHRTKNVCNSRCLVQGTLLPTTTYLWHSFLITTGRREL